MAKWGSKQMTMAHEFHYLFIFREGTFLVALEKGKPRRIRLLDEQCTLDIEINELDSKCKQVSGTLLAPSRSS